MHPKLAETFSKYKNIILVGGGTGGHIQPILNIALELQDSKKLIWIGGKSSNEEKEAIKAGIGFKSISVLKLSTTKSPKILLYPFVLIKGFFEARKIINTEGEMCIFSKGGPGSVAVGIAAWSLGVPLYIHESDTIPGKSNRVLGRFATKIFLGFESTKKYFIKEKCDVIGQILHRVFYEKIKREGLINWKTSKKHILVICGSQGAKSVFEAIIKQFIGDNPFEWIISLGKLNSNMRKEFKEINSLQCFDWIGQEDIASLLENADIVITRGSATTLAEIDTFSRKKIIIPLPSSANNHQLYNAKEYEKAGDIILEQKDIHLLKSKIENLCQRK